MKKVWVLVVIVLILACTVVPLTGCEGGYTPNGWMWFTGQKG